MGQKRSIDELARMMLTLQSRGCHNINVVTPTHYLPHIILALDKAAAKGLKLPVVYNTCGWERMEIMKMIAHEQADRLPLVGKAAVHEHHHEDEEHGHHHHHHMLLDQV